MRVSSAKPPLLVALVVSLGLATAKPAVAEEEPERGPPPSTRRPACDFMPSGKLGFGVAAHRDAPLAFSFDARVSVYNARLGECAVLSPRVGYQYDASEAAGGHFATVAPALVYPARPVGFAVLPTMLVGGSRAGFALGFSPTVQVNFFVGLLGLELAPERVWATRGAVFDAVRLHLTFDIGELVAFIWAVDTMVHHGARGGGSPPQRAVFE